MAKTTQKPDQNSPCDCGRSATGMCTTACLEGPNARSKGGRPRRGEWTEDRLLEICARVALGETLTAIAKEPGQPTPAQFRAAVMRSPMLSDAWDRARSERPHSLFEQAIDMARELKDTTWERDDTNKVRALQIAIDALRTAAARLAPREYGDRQSGAVVVPVQINTTLALTPGTAGQRRSSIYQIEASLPEPAE